MFIKTCIRKKDGKEFRTHYLTESYRDKKTGKIKHRHISNLTSLSDEQILMLKNSFKGDIKNNVNLDKIEVIDTKEYGNIKIMGNLFDKDFSKKIDKKYYNEIKSIVLNKIFEPKSKNGLDNWLKQVDLGFRIDTSSKQKKLYSAIDYLEDNQDEIEKNLIKKNKIKQADLLLYDITSTYFEGKGDENICKYGYSRDHRQDRVQVNIGLVTDKTGLPVRVEIIEGNITDKQTIEGKIKDLKEELGIENITFIFDRGMKSELNLKTIQEAGYDYITALSHAQLRQKAIENKEIQMSLLDKKNLAEFIIEDRKYILCHNPLKQEKDRLDREKLGIISKTGE